MKTFKYLKVMALAIGLQASGCEDEIIQRTDDDEDDVIVHPPPPPPSPPPIIPIDSLEQG